MRSFNRRSTDWLGLRGARPRRALIKKGEYGSRRDVSQGTTARPPPRGRHLPVARQPPTPRRRYPCSKARQRQGPTTDVATLTPGSVAGSSVEREPRTAPHSSTKSTRSMMSSPRRTRPMVPRSPTPLGALLRCLPELGSRSRYAHQPLHRWRIAGRIPMAVVVESDQGHARSYLVQGRMPFYRASRRHVHFQL